MLVQQVQEVFVQQWRWQQQRRWRQQILAAEAAAARSYLEQQACNAACG
jgi:hypothetical protein